MAGAGFALFVPMLRVIQTVVVLLACGSWAQAGNLTVLPVELGRSPTALKSVAPEDLNEVIESLLPPEVKPPSPGANGSIKKSAKDESGNKPIKPAKKAEVTSNKKEGAGEKPAREPKLEKGAPPKRTSISKPASKRSTLYGLQIKVESAEDGTPMVVGQIVRNDGKVVRGPVSVRWQPGGEGEWRANLKGALERVVKELQPATLSASASATDSPPVPVVDATPPIGPPQPLAEAPREASLPPPPPPPSLDVVRPAERVNPLKGVGIALTFGGAALLASGAIVNVVGRLQAGQVLNQDGILKFGSGDAEAERARAATTMQMVGATLGAAGLAAGVAGLICWLKAPSDQTPQVTITVSSGGFGLVVQGALP